MNALLDRLAEKKLAVNILGVPCNQFGHQEPAPNRTELYNGLKFVRPGNDYVPKFNLTMPSDVNGEKQLPLYAYLKSRCDVPLHAAYKKTESFWDPIRPNDIMWNFEKFLISPQGQPLFRFAPDVEPNDLEPLFELDLSAAKNGGMASLDNGDNSVVDLQNILRTIEANVKKRVLEKENNTKQEHKHWKG